MKKHILVVDDEENWRSTLSEKIEYELPVFVVRARSGNIAKQLLEDGTSFDLIVSDYQMSDGTGADLLQYVIQKFPKIPFALFTSMPNPLIPLGHEHFIGVYEKIQLDDLIHSIRSTLNWGKK
jgi:CheY-like chemotaxis protein